VGDKAAWAPRIATGKDALYKAALNGLNAMPAKGGNPSLSDEQVKAVVDYMVAQAK
jgi:cytochrome c5